MTLTMTDKQAKKLTKALRNVALNSGWCKDELNECGVIDEYVKVMTAVLTALDIEILIDGISYRFYMFGRKRKDEE